MNATLLRMLATADRDALSDGGLERLHDLLRREGVSCAQLAEVWLHLLASKVDPPLARGLACVAAAADRSGVANAFHNPAHSREVAVNWWLLARLHSGAAPPLSHDAILLGLIAAFGHDLDHDGRGNGTGEQYVPFRLEGVAAAKVDTLLWQAGVSDEHRAAVFAMILSTDIRDGYAQLVGKGSDDPRFHPLADDSVMLSARMLRDADILPSAGTSIAAYRMRTAELEAEAGLSPGALSGAAAAGFFDHIVAHRFFSPAAQIFTDTLHAIAAGATAD